jgi:hypothetical protein
MSAGKGDTPRLVDAKKYWTNYDNIFRIMKCSRCGSTHPNIECYVCWEEPKEETRDFDDHNQEIFEELDDEG